MVHSLQHHYTDDSGFKAIGSQPIWTFRAVKPPGPHPVGAYFTTLPSGTPKLAARLRLPKRKIEYVFRFADIGDLIPIEGDRGEFIFYSPSDYSVERKRQIDAGLRVDVQERFDDRGS